MQKQWKHRNFYRHFRKLPLIFSKFCAVAGSNAIEEASSGGRAENVACSVENVSSGAEERATSDDDVESVYMMASSKSIDSVVEEYAKRKKNCSMLPTTNYLTKRKNSVSVRGNSVGVIDPLPPEIEQQRKTSIHKVRVTRICIFHSPSFSFLSFSHEWVSFPTRWTE